MTQGNTHCIVLTKTDPNRRPALAKRLAEMLAIDVKMAGQIVTNTPVILLDKVSPDEARQLKEERLGELPDLGGEVRVAQSPAASVKINRLQWPVRPPVFAPEKNVLQEEEEVLQDEPLLSGDDDGELAEHGLVDDLDVAGDDDELGIEDPLEPEAVDPNEALAELPDVQEVDIGDDVVEFDENEVQEYAADQVELLPDEDPVVEEAAQAEEEVVAESEDGDDEEMEAIDPNEALAELGLLDTPETAAEEAVVAVDSEEEVVAIDEEEAPVVVEDVVEEIAEVPAEEEVVAVDSEEEVVAIDEEEAPAVVEDVVEEIAEAPAVVEDVVEEVAEVPAEEDVVAVDSEEEVVALDEEAPVAIEEAVEEVSAEEEVVTVDGDEDIAVVEEDAPAVEEIAEVPAEEETLNLDDETTSAISETTEVLELGPVAKEETVQDDLLEEPVSAGDEEPVEEALDENLYIASAVDASSPESSVEEVVDVSEPTIPDPTTEGIPEENPDLEEIKIEGEGDVLEEPAEEVAEVSAEEEVLPLNEEPVEEVAADEEAVDEAVEEVAEVSAEEEEPVDGEAIPETEEATEEPVVDEAVDEAVATEEEPVEEAGSYNLIMHHVSLPSQAAAAEILCRIRPELDEAAAKAAVKKKIVSVLKGVSKREADKLGEELDAIGIPFRVMESK